jgi:hypothetical protein
MVSSGYAAVYVPADHAGEHLSHLCECAVDPAAVQSCTGWLFLHTDGEDSPSAASTGTTSHLRSGTLARWSLGDEAQCWSRVGRLAPLGQGDQYGEIADACEIICI